MPLSLLSISLWEGFILSDFALVVTVLVSASRVGDLDLARN